MDIVNESPMFITLPRPWGETPDYPGVSYLYFLLDLREVPFRVRGSIGTLHRSIGILVGQFVFPFISNFVGFFTLVAL